MSFKGLTVNTAASADAHIFAEDDAAIYQAIFGGDGVMNIGNKFAATVLSNNKVRVSDGVLCVGGHIGRMQYADYADLTIENGTSGKNRNDIIYAKFVTSGEIDSYVLDVRKGTAGSTAADPAMTQGNLYQGATLREYPLWRVKIEGLSIVKVEQMFSVIPTIPELQSGLSELNSKLSNDVHGSRIGYYAEKQYTINDMQNATKGTIKIINRNGVVTIYINNLVCEPDTAILDINPYVGNNFYMYDKSGTGLYMTV